MTLNEAVGTMGIVSWMSRLPYSIAAMAVVVVVMKNQNSGERRMGTLARLKRTCWANKRDAFMPHSVETLHESSRTIAQPLRVCARMPTVYETTVLGVTWKGTDADVLCTLGPVSEGFWLASEKVVHKVSRLIE